MEIHMRLIENNLMFILGELRDQQEIASHFPPEMQSFDEQITQIQEYVMIAGEYGLGYECIVALLESFPFKLSGLAAVRLLETGLLMGYKTERPEDAQFDKRQ